MIFINYNSYSAIADLHTFQFTVAHALVFSAFTSRLLATDLNTEISTSYHYEVFLLFRLQSLWNLGAKNASGLTPPAYNWLVTALNEFCHSYLHSRGTDIANTYHVIAIQPVYWRIGRTTENTASSIVACWTVFTKLLPRNALIKSVTICTLVILAFC
jgi:hypothetical protein